MKSRPNLVLAVLFALVLAFAVGTVLIVSKEAQPDFDLNTPEGTAQAYAVAILGEDQAALARLLDSNTKCDLSGDDLGYLPTSQSAQVRLQHAEVSGDSAHVAVLIQQTDGLYDSWEHQEMITVKQVGGTWMVDDASWPFYGCE